MLRGKIPHFRLTCVAQKRRCLSSLLSPLERLLKITVILIKALFLAVSKKFRELLPIEITKTIQNHIPYNQSTFKSLRSQCLR